MFYNKLPDFSPVMVAKVEYWFEIAKIMTDGFMNNYNVEESCFWSMVFSPFVTPAIISFLSLPGY